MQKRMGTENYREATEQGLLPCEVKDYQLEQLHGLVVLLAT
jgi:hypothetical protein